MIDPRGLGDAGPTPQGSGRKTLKVLALLGSHRLKGNSAKALAAASEALAAKGVAVERIDLGRLASARPCRGCDGCLRSGRNRCVIDDDLIAVIDAARGADAIVIASPVYYFGFNSLTKIFLERCFHSSRGGGDEPNLMKAKRFGLILTYGGEDEVDSGARNAIGTFRDIADYVGFEVAGIVHGMTPDETGPDAKLLAACRGLGEALAR